MKKLTAAQTELLTRLKLYLGKDEPKPYDNLKNLCEFKSFDTSFNALLEKGHVKRHPTTDYSNQFKIS